MKFRSRLLTELLIAKGEERGKEKARPVKKTAHKVGRQSRKIVRLTFLAAHHAEGLRNYAAAFFFSAAEEAILPVIVHLKVLADIEINI